MPFRRIAIVWSELSGDMTQLARRLAAVLQAEGVRVILEANAVGPGAPENCDVLDMASICRTCDLAIIVGNDRTVLRYARELVHCSVPLVGVNHDRLGFLAALAIEESFQALRDILHGAFTIETRALLEATLHRDEARLLREHAMNDVVVSRSESSGLIEIAVEIDGQHAMVLRGDGLIMATPTGSTAYGLAAGGPILHPELQGFGLLPVAGHSLMHRPLVLPAASSVILSMRGEREGTINIDGLASASMKVGDRLLIRQSALQAKFVHPRGWNYFETLRRKLGWHALS